MMGQMQVLYNASLFLSDILLRLQMSAYTLLMTYVLSVMTLYAAGKTVSSLERHLDDDLQTISMSRKASQLYNWFDTIPTEKYLICISIDNSIPQSIDTFFVFHWTWPFGYIYVFCERDIGKRINAQLKWMS